MDRVNEVTQDCFAALLQVAAAQPEALPPPQTMHVRLRGLVDELVKRAGQQGFNQQDGQDIAYAVVALCDELALSKPETVRDYWMANTLQFHYFQENLAGDGFFTKLAALRNDPQRAEVLRVYYLCLLFGFQGRYRVRGGDLELMNLTESVQQDLARAGQLTSSETLSPHGKPPPTRLGGVKTSAPLLVVAAGVLGLALLIYGGLRLALHQSVGSFSDEVSARLKP